MANGIKIGNLDISAFKVGSGDCKVYLGDTLLYEPTPPTPPGFQGKWLATYMNMSTTSADCDASSAITSGEINITQLATLEIGDCVTSITDWAYVSFNDLTSLTIGSGITSIGDNFYSCQYLTGVTIYATTPPQITSNTFGGSYPILVPDDYVNQYKNSWSSLARRIRGINQPTTLQWVTFNGGDVIGSSIQIYGIKGTADYLSYTFDNMADDIYFEQGPFTNCYIGGVTSSCYTNSYMGLENVELIFSNLGTCSDYYTLSGSRSVQLGTIQLYIYA